jgi:hypothetical protein
MSRIIDGISDCAIPDYRGQLTERSYAGGYTDTKTKDNTPDDDLRNGERGADDDSADDEEEIPDSQDPFTADSICQRASSESADEGSDRGTGGDPSIALL